MVKDINPVGGGSTSPGSGRQPHHLLHGRRRRPRAELWRSDGTAKGTRMVKDINPGSQGGQPSTSPTSTASSTSPRREGNASGLWRSDGTEAGTTLVKRSPTRASTHSSTSTAPSTSAATAVSIQICGAATAPRRGRPGQGHHFVDIWAHRLQRHPLLQRRQRQRGGRAVAKRRHRGRHDAWSRTRSRSSATSPTSTAPSTSPLPADRSLPERAVAKRRHRGRDHPGQETRVASSVLLAVKGDRLLQRRRKPMAKQRHPAGNDRRQGKRPGGYFPSD